MALQSKFLFFSVFLFSYVNAGYQHHAGGGYYEHMSPSHLPPSSLYHHQQTDINSVEQNDESAFDIGADKDDQEQHDSVLRGEEEEEEEEEEDIGGESFQHSQLQQAGQHRITWGRANTKDAYFDDMTPTNVTAVVGQTARLPCRVINLGQKDVTWIRNRDIHILTLGVSTYTSDARFTVVRNKKTKEWILQISPVTFRDAGVYECQVSTSPKISLPVTLNVEVQQARIQGPTEVYIQNGSTISLTCVVNTHSENVGAVTWYRDSDSLDYDSPRGGVSLEIEKTPTRTTSKLFITRAIKADSGNYTCAPEFADAAYVIVHVVNGEESAAVQTGSAMSGKVFPSSNCCQRVSALVCIAIATTLVGRR